MLKVISFTICPFVQRVTALLEAKGIPYKIEYISLSDKPDWFLEISPNAQVPLLLTENGTALFESDAIVEYLEEAYPALRGDRSAEQKAMDRAWSYLGSKNYLVQCSAQRSPTLATLNERSQKLNKAFNTVEQQLSEHHCYFIDDQLSLVDIAWLPLLHRAAIIEKNSGYDFLASFPKLKRWQEFLLETAIPARSVSNDFIEKFTGFYLSKETYLGNECQNCQSQAEDNCKTGLCC